MKTKHLFGRVLSAVLILFGSTVFTYGDDDPLADYDNTHHLVINKTSPRPDEIPNSGLIPSDPNGDYLGVITYGGKGTRVGAFGGIRPTNPNGSTNIYYGENGKKQLIEFNNLDVLNVFDQSKGLNLRFGGYGTYVFGDIVTAGNSIIKPMPGDIITADQNWIGGYVNNGDIKGNDIFNSSEDEIKLPKGVTKDDIVFARLYWFGHLYNGHNEVIDNSFGEENCDANDKAEAARRGAQCRRFPKKLNLPQIKGYHDVKLKIEDSKVYDIKRENCQGHFVFNSSRNSQQGQNQRFNMNYTCSADITALVKENFEDYEDEIEISVGNINATKDAPYYIGQSNRQGNMVWSRTVATATKNVDEGYIQGNNTQRLPFGGWYVVLVYDKTQRAQQELYSNPGKIGANSDSEVKEHINKFFKPKNVSLYDGYLAMEPPIPAEFSDGRGIRDCAIGVDYDLTGFFTPKSGPVQGKFITGNFGANRGYYTDTTGLEGIFVAENKADVDKNRLPNDGKYHTRSLFNGSKTWLELDDDGNYKLKGITGNTDTANRGYHQAFDLDEFDISSKLKNSQSNLAVRLRMLPDTANTTNRAFVSFLGLSVDIYVPKLCYMVDIYDTAGWLGFFDKNTGERKPKTAADIKQIEKLYGDKDTGTVVDRPIVAGENLFFRVKFYNQPGDSEDATGVWVKPMWNSNTYQPNSSAIDNTLSKAELADADAFVYLKDNAMGAYSNMSDVFKNADPDKFENRKFMTNDSEGVKYYIGSGAGEIKDNTPVGGLLPIGKTAFVEFNATTGRTYAYRPIKYTVGYKISIAGGEPISGPSYEMDECKDPGTPIKLSVLNGLQVVNQNFEDLGHDTESDIEKTNSQDDRLFTQIAELPFNANLIFRPNAEEIFPCKEKGVDGKCADYGSIDGKSVCESFKELFVLQNNKCVRKTNDEAKAQFKDMDGGLKDFKLPGKLYLSAIRSGFYGACSLIGDSDKLPFKIKDEKNYILNYETGFSEYQKQHNTKILPLEELEIGDAFNGVTFMLSYFPAALSSEDRNTTQILDKGISALGSTFIETDLDAISGEIITNVVQLYDNNSSIQDVVNDDYIKYFLYLYEEILREKELKNYKISLTDDKKLDILRNMSLEAYNKIKDTLEPIRSEFIQAKQFFGTSLSLDGSFHVCSSDNFVVRPAYFETKNENFNKYVKFVQPNSDGDITRNSNVVTYHDNDLRVGGDYRENVDVLSKTFYARSNNGNPVPNYYAIIGGDLGRSKFGVRNSFIDGSYSGGDGTVNNNLLKNSVIREIKTYLKPFISNSCYEGSNAQSFYIERDITKQQNLRVANCKPQYFGFTGNSSNTRENYDFTYSDINSLKNGGNRDKIGKIDNIAGDRDTCGTYAFEEYYWRVWDRDAISMWADFGIKNSQTTDGHISDITRVPYEDLISEGLKDPKDKIDRVAILSTSKLYGKNDTNAKQRIGDVFNYFNVGDVMISLYDNKWTDNYGDQTFLQTKDYEDNYWGTKCVINSTSNIHNEDGKVGCDIGMKDNQYPVLRFRPDRIRIAVSELENSNTSTSGIDTFTYFNQPDIETTTPDGINNQARTQYLENLARLNFDATAYLSDAVFNDVVATLYDGRRVMVDGDEDSSVARCGFASDLRLQLNFNFDCSNPAYATDTRCFNGNANQLATGYTYSPIKFHENVPELDITIPAGTQFFDDNICSNNAVWDSRCFKYNRKTTVSEFTQGTNHNLPLPMQNAINFYTNLDTNASGFVNERHTTGIFSPKHNIFTLLAEGFDMGQTMRYALNNTNTAIESTGAKTATIYLNFDRLHKDPQRPVIIYASDFNIQNVTIKDVIEPASFTKAFNLLQPTGDNHETYTGNITPRFNETFSNYIGRISAQYGGNVTPRIPVNTGRYAMFIYGKVNEPNDGRTMYIGDFGVPIAINVLYSIYCGRNDSCLAASLPTDVLPSDGRPMVAAAQTIFDSILAQDPNALGGDGFMRNVLENANAINIGTVFVNQYNPESTSINANRNNALIAGSEGTSYTCVAGAGGATAALQSTIRVITEPYFIFTPANNNPTVFVNGIGPDGRRILYNSQIVRCVPAGTWGGAGGTKDGDIVGTFVGDEEGVNEQETFIDGRRINNNRIDW